MDLFAPLGGETVRLTQVVLASLSIGCAALLFVARAKGINSLRRAVVVVLVLLAALAIFAYHNLGRLHRGQPVNIYDTYHYYMGSKYFEELGYWYLYDATLVASDEEWLPTIGQAKAFRDQRTYTYVPKHWAYKSLPQWRPKFTDDRWRQFKQDLSYFDSRTSRRVWQKMLVDKGYNPTPTWTMLGKALAGAVPARDGLGMILLCHLDLLCIAGIIAGIWWAFGIEVSLLSAVFLGVNFTTPYGPIGGAFLRWDYCMWAVLAICAMKKRLPFVSGVLLCYATMLRISPIAFAAGVLATTFWALLRKLARADASCPQTDHDQGIEHGEKRSWCFRWIASSAGAPETHPASGTLRSGLRFGAGFLAAAILLFGLSSMLVPQGMRSWAEWYDKMKLHQESLGTKRYGLKYLFTYEGEVSRDDLKLSDGGWAAYDERKLTRLERLKWEQIAVKAAILLWFVLAVAHKEPWEGMALGSLFIFVFLSPTRYYYAQLVTLVPLLTYGCRNWARHWGYFLLMLAMIAAYFFYSFQKEYAFMQFVVSVSLLVVYLYLLVCFTVEEIRPKLVEAPSDALH